MIELTMVFAGILFGIYSTLLVQEVLKRETPEPPPIVCADWDDDDDWDEDDWDEDDWDDDDFDEDFDDLDDLDDDDDFDDFDCDDEDGCDECDMREECPDAF